MPARSKGRQRRCAEARAASSGDEASGGGAGGASSDDGWAAAFVVASSASPPEPEKGVESSARARAVTGRRGIILVLRRRRRWGAEEAGEEEEEGAKEEEVEVAADDAEARARRGSLRCRRADADIGDAARAGVAFAFGAALARGPRTRGAVAASAGILLDGLAQQQQQGAWRDGEGAEHSAILLLSRRFVCGARTEAKKKTLAHSPLLCPPAERAPYLSLSLLRWN